jgi:transposase InsO family protein
MLRAATPLPKCEPPRPVRWNLGGHGPADRFIRTLKKELTRGETFATWEEARASVFEYIEIFDNRERRHSSLGYPAVEIGDLLDGGRECLVPEDLR